MAAAEKAVGCMQGGVPEGIGHIVGAHLSQYLRTEDEEENDVLQSVGDVDAGVGLDEGGNGKEHERQNTQEDVLIVLVEHLGDEDEDDHQA